MTDAPCLDDQTRRHRPAAVPPARHTTLALLALAFGGFAIGTTEFVSMGLLPDIAEGVEVSIPVAGHVISAYALGVVVGAPLLAVLGARLSRQRQLLWLMAAFTAGNLASALAPDYGWLLVARFLSGLPHGAFFGIGAVVAASMVAPNRRGWAVSMMLTGLTVANIVGVPAGTLLGQHLGWRWPYGMVAVIGVLTFAAVAVWVPRDPAHPDASVSGELTALRRLQVWLALLIGAVGFGGMFAAYTYITPTLTTLAGFGERAVPLLLAVYGVGMTLGMMVGGRLADAALKRALVGGLVYAMVVLAGFGWLAQNKITAVLAMFLLGSVGSLIVPALQTRLLDVSHRGQALAGALNHSTLNLANAAGAWLGGVVLAAGYGYAWPARVGVVLAAAGLVVAAVSFGLERRTGRRLDAQPA
ncbi:MAG TPA: MFS transporter [Nocardioidaceae bacterium]|nr:MFS transporter [Nocardioidaceae bacterium]